MPLFHAKAHILIEGLCPQKWGENMEAWKGYEAEEERQGKDRMPKEENSQMKDSEVILEDGTIYEIDMECMKRKGYKFWQP